MKTLKILIALVRFFVLKNKMLIASGVSGKLNASGTWNDVLDGLEALENELDAVSLLEMVLIILLALLNTGETLALAAALAAFAMLPAAMGAGLAGAIANIPARFTKSQIHFDNGSALSVTRGFC